MTLSLTPYLVMNGNANEAIDFYKNALGAQLLYKQTFGEMPANPEFPLPPEAKELVAHAMVKIGESDVMFSDTFPGSPHQSGNQVTLCITTKDVDQAKQAFEALQQGGQVNMPLTETFFSPAYGSLTDKFGVAFQVYTEKEQ